MTIEITGNVLTLTVENTSPTTLDGSGGTNSPGITAFGFDLEDPDPDVVGWTLSVFDANGNAVDLSNTWDLLSDKKLEGVTRDEIADNGKGSENALYNPDATSGFGGPPQWFTTATLVVEFDDAAFLDDLVAPYVRMKNFGAGGEGSLNLFGTPFVPSGDSVPTVPEPASIALLGFGAVGLGIERLRRRRTQTR